MTDQNAPANEYGCQWRALHGNRHDEHYWAYIRAVVVTLKSASDVKMTAAKMADDGGVLCVWMHDGVVQSASIPLAALVDWP